MKSLSYSTRLWRDRNLRSHNSSSINGDSIMNTVPEKFYTNIFPVTVDCEQLKNIYKFDLFVENVELLNNETSINDAIEGFFLENIIFQNIPYGFIPNDTSFYSTVDVSLYEYSSLINVSLDLAINVRIEKDHSFHTSQWEKNPELVKRFLFNEVRLKFNYFRKGNIFFENFSSRNDSNRPRRMNGFEIDILSNGEDLFLIMNIHGLIFGSDSSIKIRGPFTSISCYFYEDFVRKIILKCPCFKNIGFKIDSIPLKMDFESFPTAKRFNFMHKTSEIDWAFFSIESDISKESMNQFAEELTSYAKSINMYFNKPAIVRSMKCDKKHLISNFFYNVQQKLPRIELLLIISRFSNEDGDIVYNSFKTISESEFGIMTQCVKYRKDDLITPDYLFNLLWKINSKTGGVCSRFPIEKTILDHRKILVVGCYSTKNKTSIVSIFGDNYEKILSTCYPNDNQKQLNIHIKNAMKNSQDTIEHVVLYGAGFKSYQIVNSYIQNYEPDMSNVELRWTVVEVFSDSQIKFFSTDSRLATRTTVDRTASNCCAPLIIDPFDSQTFYLNSVEKSIITNFTKYKAYLNGFTDQEENILQKFTLALCQHSYRLSYTNRVPSVIDYASRVYERYEIYRKSMDQLDSITSEHPTINSKLQNKYFFC